MLVIAVDAMGGDNAPESVIAGVKLVQKENPDVFYLLYGDEKKILPLTKKYRLDESMFKIYHTEAVVSMDEKPSVALRTGRESSLWKAIYAVRSGEAQAVISAGNTGALMAMSKICFGMIANVDRPAIAVVMPTLKEDCVALDLGANAECNASNLVDFAIMGHVFYQILYKKEHPSIGLLNIGSEESKGRDEIKEAANTLKKLGNRFNYHGFVEGNDIGIGTVNVYVSDGFSGNVSLKSIEGTSKLIMGILKRAFKSSVLAKIGLLFALPALKKIKKTVDTRRYNGAMMLGLNSLCVKAHGNSDPFGFSCALRRTIDLVRHNLCDEIRRHMEEVVFEMEARDEEEASQKRHSLLKE